MSSNTIFRGDSQAIAQVDNLTIAGTAAAGNIVNVPINSKTVSYTALTGDTNNTIANGLLQALNASVIPEFQEILWSLSVAAPTQTAPALAAGGSLTVGTTYYWVITATLASGDTVQSNELSLTPTTGNQTATLNWVVFTGATGYHIYRSTTSGSYASPALVTTIGSGATVTYNDTGGGTTTGTPPLTGTIIAATAATPGVPFTISTPTVTGTNTLTDSTITASSGPNHWDAASNWSTGHIPCGLVTVPTPTSATPASGGSLTANTYYYKITGTNANGETTQNVEIYGTTSGGNLKLVLLWVADNAANGATGYKIYRTTSSGTYGATSLLTTITSGATVTYTDDGTVSLTTGTPPGSITAVGDDVYLTQTNTNIYYGIAQGYLNLHSLNVDSTFTGKVGLPLENPNGYYEYRARYLAVSPTTWTHGAGSGSGSGQFFIDLGSAVSGTVTIFATGTVIATGGGIGLPALVIKGVSSSVDIRSGNVGFAIDPGSTATPGTVYIGYTQSVATDVTLTFGTGCTLGVINQAAGVITAYCGLTTLNMEGDTGGTCTIFDGSTASSITTINGEAGALFYEGSGTIATLNAGAKFTLDCSRDDKGRTITNATLTAGTTILDPATSIAWTNPFLLSNCGIGDVNLNLGRQIHLQRS